MKEAKELAKGMLRKTILGKANGIQNPSADTWPVYSQNCKRAMRLERSELERKL